MKTVYVVSDGDYSDYRICSIWDSKENAEKACALIRRESGSADPSVEIWELNTVKDLKKRIYMVEVDKAGAVLEIKDCGTAAGSNFYGDLAEHNDGTHRGSVVAYNPDVARKIAFDLIAQAKAHKEGIA